MATIDDARQVLDLSKLSLPPSPKVVGIEVEDYFDMDDEPSLRVNVLIDDDTDLDHLDGEGIDAIKSTIRNSLRKKGIWLFPYIFLAMPKELEEFRLEELQENGDE